MTNLTVFATGIAVTGDDETVPITHWFDADGEDCDASDAVSCVAGPDKNGQWLSIDLSMMEGGMLQ